MSIDNNNNQAFYSQTSWGRLEMKPYEPKKQEQNKSEKEGTWKQRTIKGGGVVLGLTNQQLF
jgi:hypothetical protein